jgi:hypothetical protein
VITRTDKAFKVWQKEQGIEDELFAWKMLIAFRAGYAARESTPFDKAAAAERICAPGDTVTNSPLGRVKVNASRRVKLRPSAVSTWSLSVLKPVIISFPFANRSPTA